MTTATAKPHVHRYLRKNAAGFFVLNWTPALANRKDMIECDKDGNPLVYVAPPMPEQAPEEPTTTEPEPAHKTVNIPPGAKVMTFENAKEEIDPATKDAMQAELAKTKAEAEKQLAEEKAMEALPLEEWTNKALRAKAEAMELRTYNLRTKAALIAAIRDAEPSAPAEPQPATTPAPQPGA